MRAEVERHLAAVNAGFYRAQAQSFASTRRRLQPGVTRVLETLPDFLEAAWLDLGCGNGWLEREWVARGRRSRILGLDNSPELLAEARRTTDSPLVSFQQADFLGPSWTAAVGTGPWQGALCFAVIHHLPGEARREAFLREIAALLAPQGELWLSFWQFLRAEKWRERIQPWGAIGLEEGDVEEGDYLLDWRNTADAAPALRYVHHLSAAEVERLCGAAGWEIRERFDSDGASGNLSTYLRLDKINA